MAKKTYTTPSGSLLVATRALVRKHPGTLLDLAQSSGVEYHWLRRFRSRDVPDPSVNRVQRLFEHLSGNPLKLTERR